jgi:type VI secretion system protein ImpG
MSDLLLPYYRRELTHIRELAAEFARANPQVAERLGLPEHPDTARDPHVELLIESFAYLTGRIRRKLDDEFPELVQGMLGVLYPHLTAPIPSMAIAQIRMQQAQAGLTAGFVVPRGSEIETQVTSGRYAGQTCQYRTAYELTVLPLEVASARLGPLSGSRAADPTVQAAASLSIELKCVSPEVKFSQLDFPVLRFHLSGQDQHTLPLYELIFNNAVDGVLEGTDKPVTRVALGRSPVRPVGFEAAEAVLPYGSQSFSGYRLLSEYFTFHRKFLFFDVPLPIGALKGMGNRVFLHLFVNRASPELERVVGADTLRLGCTPIVNLFSKAADAVELDETRTEYRVDADRGPRRAAHEIYSVDRVMVAERGSRAVECRPFYSLTGRGADADKQIFWHARRRLPRRSTDPLDRGTDVYLTLVDLDYSSVAVADRTLSAQVTCLNRDLPQHLPRGGGQPKLTLVSGGPVELECVTQPTATVRANLRRGSMWRLMSQLNLNHLSISGGTQGAQTLREMLRLYNLAESVDAEAKIDGIVEVSSRVVTRRAGGVSSGGVARGVEVNIRFDEDRFADRGLFLFAGVLERFIALYCSINSFTQLMVTTKQRDGVLKKWPPRAGEQVLL